MKSVWIRGAKRRELNRMQSQSGCTKNSSLNRLNARKWLANRFLALNIPRLCSLKTSTNTSRSPRVLWAWLIPNQKCWWKYWTCSSSGVTLNSLRVRTQLSTSAFSTASKPYLTGSLLASMSCGNMKRMCLFLFSAKNQEWTMQFWKRKWSNWSNWLSNFMIPRKILPSSSNSV